MIIDMHAHLYPRAYMEEIAAKGTPYGLSLTADDPPILRFEGINFWRYTQSFYDVELRLKMLDQAGVDMQILSLGPPMLYWADPDLALRLCQIFNDAVSEVVQAHPDRFVGLAALPLQDPRRALRELDRAVGSLGMRGVGIGSNIQGKPLDHPDLLPVYERIEALDLPVFIHPINPIGHGDIHDYRLDIVLGFPLDTTLAAARLIYAGVLERFPRLKVCLAHLGGAFPSFGSASPSAMRRGPSISMIPPCSWPWPASERTGLSSGATRPSPSATSTGQWPRSGTSRFCPTGIRRASWARMPPGS